MLVHLGVITSTLLLLFPPNLHIPQYLTTGVTGYQPIRDQYFLIRSHTHLTFQHWRKKQLKGRWRPLQLAVQQAPQKQRSPRPLWNRLVIRGRALSGAATPFELAMAPYRIGLVTTHISDTVAEDGDRTETTQTVVEGSEGDHQGSSAAEGKSASKADKKPFWCCQSIGLTGARKNCGQSIALTGAIMKRLVHCCFIPYIIIMEAFMPIYQEPTETNKRPIGTRYLGHVTGSQPIRDQYFLIWSMPLAGNVIMGSTRSRILNLFLKKSKAVVKNSML
eukprot:sb/3467996/